MKFPGRRLPPKKGINWNDGLQLERQGRVVFEPIELPNLDFMVNGLVSPRFGVSANSVMHLGVFNGSHFVDESSAFLIGPGLAMTASHTILNHVEEFDAGKLAIYAAISVTKSQKTAKFRVTSISNTASKDIALLGLTMIDGPNDWQVVLNNLSMSARFPNIGERLTLFGYRRSVEPDPKFVHLRYLATTGTVSEVFPHGRDNVMLPGPSFLIDAESAGGMSGGPIVDHYGHVVGVISIGGTDEKNRHHTYGVSVIPGFLLNAKTDWPGDAFSGEPKLFDSPDVTIHHRELVEIVTEGRLRVMRPVLT